MPLTPEFKFEPRVGIRTTNGGYLHGIGDLEDMAVTYTIEHVGHDYFVMRGDNGNVELVRESSYFVIEEDDFA